MNALVFAHSLNHWLTSGCKPTLQIHCLPIVCQFYHRHEVLKLRNQAKNHKNHNFYFSFLMFMICQHVYKIELPKSYTVCLWQWNKCIENPVYQLFLCFLFWTCMSEIKFRLYFSLLVNAQPEIKIKIRDITLTYYWHIKEPK